MADNVTLDPGAGGAVVATDEVGGAQHQQVKVEFGGDGVATPVSASDPFPITVISGTVNVLGNVTVAGTVSVPGTVPVTGNVTVSGTVSVPGTVPVIGNVTVSGTVPVTVGTVSIVATGAAVPVSGTVSITGTTPVSGSVSIIGTPSVSVSGTVNVVQTGPHQPFNVVAGTTAKILGSLGGTGDFLSHLLVMVGSTDANSVILIDGTTTSYNGTVFLSVPGAGKGTYTVPIQSHSRFGPWKLTTGGGAHVVAVGKFTN